MSWNIVSQDANTIREMGSHSTCCPPTGIRPHFHLCSTPWGGGLLTGAQMSPLQLLHPERKPGSPCSSLFSLVRGEGSGGSAPEHPLPVSCLPISPVGTGADGLGQHLATRGIRLALPLLWVLVPKEVLPPFFAPQGQDWGSGSRFQGRSRWKPMGRVPPACPRPSLQF